MTDTSISSRLDRLACNPMTQETGTGIRRPQLAHGGNWTLAACVFAILAGLNACSSTQVLVAPDAARRAEWAVLVLPFDDSGCERATADFTLYGSTGAQGCGTLLAQEFATAFASEAGFRTTEPKAVRQMMQQERLSLDDLGRAGGERACALAVRLGADMVILGRVLAYRNAWFLFVSKAKVDLELRGLDTRTGEELWQARTRKSAFLKGETEIASLLGRRTVQAVRDGLTPTDRSR